MTRAELEQHVKPCTVEIDEIGTIRIFAPYGYSFERSTHFLVPYFDRYQAANKLYESVADNYDMHSLSKCPDHCLCKEKLDSEL